MLKVNDELFTMFAKYTSDITVYKMPLKHNALRNVTKIPLVLRRKSHEVWKATIVKYYITGLQGT